MGPPITEIARSLSTEKFYSSVAKMQKKRMTTPNVWASFTPQNRQGAKILANFAVKSWEDQIFGARRRCHRTTDRDHAIPVKQGFQPCFFLLFIHGGISAATFSAKSMRQRRTAALPCGTRPHVRRGKVPALRCFFQPERVGETGFSARLAERRKGRVFRKNARNGNDVLPGRRAPLIFKAAAYSKSG